MRRALLASVACLGMTCAFAGPGDQTNPFFIRPGFVTPAGYCQLTVTATAVQTSTCPGGIPKGATYALINEEGPDAVRWRDDGVAPTASVGNPLGNGTAASPVAAGFTTNFAALQWIDQGTSGAVLDISFYR